MSLLVLKGGRIVYLGMARKLDKIWRICLKIWWGRINWQRRINGRRGWQIRVAELGMGIFGIGWGWQNNFATEFTGGIAFNRIGHF
jgi:hypothetical protein